MNCCKPYNLGCFDSCGSLSFGEATVTGEAIGVFTSGNLVVSQTIDITDGEPYLFDLSMLNENNTWVLQLYIGCTQVAITVDDTEIDTFKLKTKNMGLGCVTQYADFNNDFNDDFLI